MKGGRTVTLVLVLSALAVHESAGAANCSNGTFGCPKTEGGSVYDCLPLYWLCDGDVDCPTNGTIHDESNCPPPSCGNDQFACLTSCVNIDWACDGEEDCFDGRDEENCTTSRLPGSGGCSLSEYQCRGSFCIPNDWKCDQDRDCPLGDDEEDCSQINCTESQFMCQTSGLCISKDWVCDGINECDDFSDEPASCNTNCSEGKIPCGAEGGPRICAEPEWICDGDIDCPLGWDESPAINNCSSISKCEPDEFQCSIGLCIPNSYICDGDIDCSEGEDENPNLCPPDPTLPNCTDFEFYCAASRTCLHNRKQCNGVRDCPDDSDELNCSSCDFRCTSDYMCLSQEQLCDGQQDCSDGSDESDRCDDCSENNGGCHHICVNYPTGPVCKCNKGYVLQGQQCHDIDECSVYGTCSQLCYNTHGSFICKCAAGYVMVDHPTKSHICKPIGPPGALYIAANHEIVRYLLDGSSEDILISGLKGVTDIAVDYQDEMIYWLESHYKTLKKAPLQNMSNVQVIVSEGINSPEGLTLDWVTKRLYWVDDVNNTLEVVNADGSDRRVLKDNLDRPRDIVVDPFQKTLYVSVWGDKPEIFSLKTDGSDFTTLVNTSIFWPNGLAMDFPGKRLYWVDAKYKVVETIKLDGTGRTVVKQLPERAHPWSIDVFEEMMMWSDTDRFHIYFNNRFTGDVIKNISISQPSLNGIKIAQAALQTSVPLCKPPTLPNYDLADPKFSYTAGTVVTLRCAKGYQLAGSDMVKCEENGTWFPHLPHCVPEPVSGTPAPTDRGQGNTPLIPGAGPGNRLQRDSFGIGLGAGLAICLLLAVTVVMLLLLFFWRKYRSNQMTSSAAINFYSDKHSEASVTLPEAEELDPNFSNGIIPDSV